MKITVTNRVGKIDQTLTFEDMSRDDILRFLVEHRMMTTEVISSTLSDPADLVKTTPAKGRRPDEKLRAQIAQELEASLGCADLSHLANRNKDRVRVALTVLSRHLAGDLFDFLVDEEVLK